MSEKLTTFDMSTTNEKLPWDIDSAKALYGIQNWGNNYFDINTNGELTVIDPLNPQNSPLSLMKVINGLLDR